MQNRKIQLAQRRPHPGYPQAAASEVPHAADLYVGRQVAGVRIHCDVTQAELARAVGVSPQQLQKYENGKNRISASMLFEIATFLSVPVGRFFEGLPGNARAQGEVAPLPLDERITFIASSEGRRLIEGVMRLPPRTRRRISSFIAALGEELAALNGTMACQLRETENGCGGAPGRTGSTSDDEDRERA
ncbi:helix-turn-helix domain-containing protein [Phyllobacterium endophyticum]|uniref:Transcriptional regulator n=1 Tax=Phyllobacterium endophyticum TaxID=1149773 RepID=A0A2P7AQS1_9HYPH|nr:helix-turn-helix transcriptional regulator [Phyllobacterium endophyticum]MBB3237010.1 transcriptional regulator with XRE-family HTH domain [Phyllobacterium endophyticum]PSH56582.1 transcriptional regulator [Phyllobacterium endophyticum]TYR44420.1 helix-turn-helix transcriptional regulator [Phyllobacterium endophyticum]